MWTQALLCPLFYSMYMYWYHAEEATCAVYHSHDATLECHTKKTHSMCKYQTQLDTSIKHPISGQSTPMIKCCIHGHYYAWYGRYCLWFFEEHLLSADFFLNVPSKVKEKESSMHVIWMHIAAFLLCGAEQQYRWIAFYTCSHFLTQNHLSLVFTA